MIRACLPEDKYESLLRLPLRRISGGIPPVLLILFKNKIKNKLSPSLYEPVVLRCVFLQPITAPPTPPTPAPFRGAGGSLARAFPVAGPGKHGGGSSYAAGSVSKHPEGEERCLEACLGGPSGRYVGAGPSVRCDWGVLHLPEESGFLALGNSEISWPDISTAGGCRFL